MRASLDRTAGGIAARVAAILVGAAIAASAAERNEYRLSEGRVVFAIPNEWIESSATPSDRGAFFLFPNPGPPRAQLWVQVKPADTFDASVKKVASPRNEPDHARDVLKQLPKLPSGVDALILFRDTTTGIESIAVDRIARRGPVSVHIRLGWTVARVTTADSQHWLVGEANRLMSELAVDGTPIGVVGRVVEHKDSHAPLPRLDLEE